MKKFNSKKFIVVTALALLLFVTVGSTLAYLFTKTDPVENTFNPSKVACAVVENGGKPVSGAVVNITVKENVRIQNTGDTDAYIRVAVVVNWKNASGNVWAQKPIEKTDYTIEWNLSEDGWVNGADGYYYFKNEVTPKTDCNHQDNTEYCNQCMTDILIKSCSPIAGSAPDGYSLSVEIIASAIQSSPDMVVKEQWSTGVSAANNGKLTIKKGEST